MAEFKKNNDNVSSVLPQIIKAGYKTLRLINYFTAGPDEVRAWSIRRGTCTTSRWRNSPDFEKASFVQTHIRSRPGKKLALMQMRKRK